MLPWTARFYSSVFFGGRSSTRSASGLRFRFLLNESLTSVITWPFRPLLQPLLTTGKTSAPRQNRNDGRRHAEWRYEPGRSWLHSRNPFISGQFRPLFAYSWHQYYGFNMGGNDAVNVGQYREIYHTPMYEGTCQPIFSITNWNESFIPEFRPQYHMNHRTSKSSW